MVRQIILAAVFVIVASAISRAQVLDELPEFPGDFAPVEQHLSDEVEAAASDEFAEERRGPSEEELAERQMRLAALRNEVIEFNKRGETYLEDAKQTAVQRAKQRKARIELLQQIAAAEMAMLRDGKSVPFDVVTAQVAAHQAELDELSLAQSRREACRKHAMSMQLLAKTLTEMRTAGDKRIGSAEPLRAQSAQLQAELTLLNETQGLLNPEDLANRLEQASDMGKYYESMQLGFIGGTQATAPTMAAGREYFQLRAQLASDCGRHEDASTDVQRAMQFSLGEVAAYRNAYEGGFGDGFTTGQLLTLAHAEQKNTVALAHRVMRATAKSFPELELIKKQNEHP